MKNITIILSPRPTITGTWLAFGEDAYDVPTVEALSDGTSVDPGTYGRGSDPCKAVEDLIRRAEAESAGLGSLVKDAPLPVAGMCLGGCQTIMVPAGMCTRCVKMKADNTSEVLAYLKGKLAERQTESPDMREATVAEVTRRLEKKVDEYRAKGQLAPTVRVHSFDPKTGRIEVEFANVSATGADDDGTFRP